MASGDIGGISAGLLLGDRKVALVELGAVDRGDQRVLVLGAERAGGCQQQRQSGGEDAGRAGETGNRHGLSLARVRNLRTAADLSPNNHGFAMAGRREGLNVRVSGRAFDRVRPVKAAVRRQ